MTIRIPASVNKTALIARFTTTEGDVVRIGAVEQKSGITANNFNNPVDYVVRDDAAEISTPYTVTVKKILEMKWTKVGEYNDVNNWSATSMAVSPTTGEPYILFQQGTSASANKATVVKFVGTGFTAVGNREFSAGVVRKPVIRFSPDGTPFVMYQDGNTSPANKPTIMKYSGSAWSAVGEAGYADAANTSYSVDFVVYGSDNKILSIHEQNAAAAIPRREMNISYWNGTSWSANNQVSGGLLPSGDVNAATNAKLAIYGNNIYMVVALNGAGYSVVKYDGSAWTLLADKATFGGNTGIYISDVAIATDNTGVLYVGVPDNANNYIRIARYSTTLNNWSVIGGGPISRATSSNTNFKLAFDAQNNPFLLYITRDDSTSPWTANIVTIDPETLSWTDPIVLLSDIQNEPMSLDVTKDGDIYASFVTRVPSSNYIYHLYKYSLEADE